MSKKFVTHQTYKINQSLSVISGLYLLHSIALCSAFISTVFIAYKVILMGGIVFSLYYYLKQDIKYSNFFIRYGATIGWEIAYLDNYFRTIEILPSTVLTPFFIVLHIKEHNRKKQAILICKDALKNDEYRKMMVELKISGLLKDKV